PQYHRVPRRGTRRAGAHRSPHGREQPAGVSPSGRLRAAVTPRPYVVGLTGGIGSGKTAVADGLGRLGAALVDTDLIAHTLTAPGGAAMAEIETAFGPAVIAADGSLDRAAMRALAFSDPAA